MFASAQDMPASPDDAVAVVVVGDIYEFLNSAGGVASAVSPMFNGQYLRQMLGAQVGDPTLEGIKPGNGMAVMFWPDNTYSAYIEVEAAKQDTYIQAAEAQGQKLAKAGTMLAQGTADVASNIKYAPLAQTLLKNATAPTLKATVNMPVAMKMFEPQIQQFEQSIQLGQMQQNQAGGQAANDFAQKVLSAELMAFVSLGKQMEIMGLELSTEKANILFQMTCVAKPDTNLSAFLSSPAKDPLQMMKMVPDEGAMRGAAAYNSDAMAKLVDAEMGPIVEKMGLTAEEKASLQKSLDSSMYMYDGLFSMDYMVPGQSLLSGSMVYSVKDGVNVAEVMKNNIENQQGMMKMYKDAGMDFDMQFQENAASYKGVAIHKYNVKMDMQQAQGMNNPMLQGMFGPEGMSVNVADVNGKLVYTFSDDKIESLIDAAKAGAHPKAGKLSAVEFFGPSKQAYFDMNIGRLASVVKTMAASMGAQPQGQNPMDQYVAVLSTVPAITMAGEWGQGDEASMSLAIPVDLIGKGYQIFMMQMAQRMQSGPQQQGGQGQGGPQPF